MSDNELSLSSDRLYISKSTKDGKITYCNQALLELGGYQENKLIGQPHNIMRHPDMPRGLFLMLWQTLKARQEFNAFIKNRTNNDQFYWAFTNITPVCNPQAQVTGYICTRRKANPAGIMMFETYYDTMREIEKNDNSDAAAQRGIDELQQMLSAMGDDYEASVFKLQFS